VLSKMPFSSDSIIHWFRQAAPYINSHRHKTIVVMVSGDALQSRNSTSLLHDLALLHSLGMRLIIVHGSRVQIEQSIHQNKINGRFENGIRISDTASMPLILAAVSALSQRVLAQLSANLPNTPLSGAALNVVSGNFVSARPLGMLNGVDMQFTGKVRSVNAQGLLQHLQQNSVILLSNLGYSRTGEVFNLPVEEVAAEVAIACQADKLLLFMESDTLLADGHDFRQLSTTEARQFLHLEQLTESHRNLLNQAIRVVEQGVKRCHLLSSQTDGSLLLELFSRDGCGSLITNQFYHGLRAATDADINSIMQLIEPLEQQGTLVRRSREQLEQEIQQFQVLELDGSLIGCAACLAFPEVGMAELACLVVDPAYARQGYASQLLHRVEQLAQQSGCEQLFALSTVTMHWFQERGFVHSDLDQLPQQKQQLYNYQRNSKVFIKTLEAL